MFFPHGSQPAAVYWRRRVVLLASIVVLLAGIAVGVRVLLPDGRSTTGAAGTTAPQTTQYPTPHSKPHTTPTPRPHTIRPQSSRSRPPTSIAASKSASPLVLPPKQCDVRQLKLTAVSDRSSYHAGASPVLMLQVTNTAASPCVQDLADRQVELRVYNGESRVWGSHDCTILPGTDDHSLAGHSAVRVSVVWSGLSSQPRCAGTRQQAGAGTYTLYASLGGRDGSAAQFSIR
ncbi:MAG: hypothetical protein M3070_18910 [Actinomycetota bacterium]|nr:hypothetical protein [Actinomycetota bacterium]